MENLYEKGKLYAGFDKSVRNLKIWKKFVCNMVVKMKEIGYTMVMNFLGCSRALLF